MMSYVIVYHTWSTFWCLCYKHYPLTFLRMQLSREIPLSVCSRMSTSTLSWLFFPRSAVFSSTRMWACSHSWLNRVFIVFIFWTVNLVVSGSFWSTSRCMSASIAAKWLSISFSNLLFGKRKDGEVNQKDVLGHTCMGEQKIARHLFRLCNTSIQRTERICFLPYFTALVVSKSVTVYKKLHLFFSSSAFISKLWMIALCSSSWLDNCFSRDSMFDISCSFCFWNSSRLASLATGRRKEKRGVI